MKILALCTIKTQLWCFLKTKNYQKFLALIGPANLNGLCLKLEKRPSKGQKRPSHEAACPFHSATYSEICSYFTKFGQNCSFQRHFCPR